MLAEGALPRQVWAPLMLGEGTDTGIALRICVAAADRAYCHHNPVPGLPAQSGLAPGSARELVTGSGTNVCTIMGSVVSPWPYGPYPAAHAWRWRACHRRLY